MSVHDSDLIEKLTQPLGENYAKALSGEAAGSFQNTRNTMGVGPLHPFGIEHALAFVQEEMERFGFTTERVEYLAGYAPNLVSCMTGTVTPNSIVVMGAHLDDIPSTGRAPGANDDGSGSASLLAAASAIFEYGATFGSTLCLEHYTGEEQGLLGSRAQATARAKRGDDVVAMLQQDMIAVKKEGDDFGLAFVTSPSASDPVLTQTAQMIMRTYADRELILHPAVLSGKSSIGT
jgi:acetylornithine deacetylase/succinyl-diaminopimelate desuccinylase-like protein